MAKVFSKAFYNSKAWRNVSTHYMLKKHYICERCGGVASICHHKHWLNEWNVNDMRVSLDEQNLECLCQSCHNREHATREGACVFSADGQVVGTRENAELREFREAREAIDGILL